MYWWESSQAAPRLLRGIEAGVAGGIAMFALLMGGSLWRGDPWWMPANLLGSTIYGRPALDFGPGRATLAGGALHVFLTGLVGAVFGLICGGVRRRRRLMLLGLLSGLVWHTLTASVLWNQLNPLIPAFSPEPATLFSHALFGTCLGYMSGILPSSAAGDRQRPEPQPDAVE